MENRFNSFKNITTTTHISNNQRETKLFICFRLSAKSSNETSE